jgi:hypothetical protein
MGRDYPGANVDDTQLPVDTVYIKSHDGTDWMSTYDRSPGAINGVDSLRQWVSYYNQRNINVVAWFVPKAGDLETQVRMAEAVIDSGVKGLYADVEPFTYFCHLDCLWLAQNLWARVSGQKDPRRSWALSMTRAPGGGTTPALPPGSPTPT